MRLRRALHVAAEMSWWAVTSRHYLMAALAAQHTLHVSMVTGMGQSRALWLRRLMLGGISKAICGYGIEEYKQGGTKAMVTNIQNNYLVFSDKPDKASDLEKDAFQKNVAYLKEALNAVSDRGMDMPHHVATIKSLWMCTMCRLWLQTACLDA